MVRLLPTIQFNFRDDVVVSIPQWCDCCLHRRRYLAIAQDGFNPTMVRLLRSQFHDERLRDFKFQSHNGAIAAIRTQPTANSNLSFNPTMVRLLRVGS